MMSEDEMLPHLLAIFGVVMKRHNLDSVEVTYEELRSGPHALMVRQSETGFEIRQGDDMLSAEDRTRLQATADERGEPFTEVSTVSFKD